MNPVPHVKVFLKKYAIQRLRVPGRLILVAEKTVAPIRLKRLFFRKNTKFQPVKQKPLPSLSFCILMDLLGYASFAIPFFGEFFDLLWAPISGLIYMKTFGGAKGFLGGGFAFLEELLPGMDIIPTFTITWFMQHARRKKEQTASYTIIK